MPNPSKRILPPAAWPRIRTNTPITTSLFHASSIPHARLQPKRKKKGFTLVELLVVIAIIGLLLAVLIPALTKARDIGKRLICAANLRTMGLGLTLYADGHDDWYVPCIERLVLSDETTWTYWPNNQDFRKVMGYTDMQSSDEGWNAPKEYLCPSDRVSNKELVDLINDWNNYLSYGYNITDWYHPNSNWFSMSYTGHKSTFIKNPSGEMIWGESNDWWFWWLGADYTLGWDILGHDTITAYQAEQSYGPTLYRHNEGANYNFYDGHVEYMKKQEAWSQEDWDNGNPKMWSIFGNYPPTTQQMDSIPTP